MATAQTARDQIYAIVVGAVVVHHRQRFDVTQGQLAQLAGTSQATISRVERGRALFELRALARALALTEQVLTARIDEAFMMTLTVGMKVLPPQKSTETWPDAWCEMALAEVGIVGFTGLATFAAAAGRVG